MFNDDIDQDPVSNALKSRRIPHGRSRNNNRGGKGSGRGAFDPLRAVGVYSIRYGTATKGSKNDDVVRDATPSRMTIHGLTDEETGFLASLDVGGVITGMAILAGSRKELNRIVEELEAEATSSEEENEDRDEDQVGHVSIEDDDETHNTQKSSDGEDDDLPDPPQQSALEAEDERINRRARAFEKNSFRNPKFWMRWKGHVKPKEGEEVNESNTAYIIFTGNDCTSFSGTISSDVLGWDNVRLEGQKTSPHAGDCPLTWSAFD